jgi:hypothetical protein
MLLLSSLLLLVAGVTAPAFVNTVACIPAIAGIAAIAGVSLVPDVLSVVGLPVIAGVPGVVDFHAVAFVPVAACVPAIAVILATASVHPGIPILAGVLTYCMYCTLRHIRLSDYRKMLIFLLSNYRNIEYRIGEF